MNATTHSPVATRFAWKEYRTLRALCLAVLFLGVFIQGVSALFSAPGSSLPAVMFGAALGAAILYAVAAAAILFSGEHEEESYQFLSGLPVRWLPMTAGKLAVATGSVVAIAILLVFTGWLLAGFRWPPASVAQELFSLLGVGIFEALAWATLFSLLVKRPLTAVALAVMVSILVVQLASATFAESSTGLADLKTYSRAVPLRLAILALVLVGIVNIARGWLGTLPRRKKTAPALQKSDGVTIPTQTQQHSAGKLLFGPSSFTMLIRLLWQACRQSWKSLLLPFAITIGVGFCAALLTGVGSFAGIFVLPALFGALAFSGDQCHRQFRYLAEHAARPRHVWLSRHLLWFGTLVGTMLLLAIAVSLLAANSAIPSSQPRLQTRIEWPTLFVLESLDIQLLFSGTGRLIWIAGLIGLGTIAAYAVGQLISMIVRSEIIATLLSALFSVVITAWTLVLVFWFLDVWWFLLPIAIGFFLATWLRAPDWIIERNTWQAWSKPALAVVLPLVFVGLSLPAARLRQVPNYRDQIEPLVVRLQDGDTSAARETAAMYEEAVQLNYAWMQSQLLERWSGLEFAHDNSIGLVDRIDESRIPADEREEYRAALETTRNLQKTGWASAAKLALEASRRPECRFDLDWSSTSVPTSHDRDFNDREAAWRRVHANYYGTRQLAWNLFSSPLEDQASCLAAAVRICEHLREGQPTAPAARALSLEADILQAISGWARRDVVTTDELRELKSQLERHFQQSTYDPKSSLAADQLLVERVIDGDAEPLIFDHRPIPWMFQLAYLANQLPWERSRARLALDAITAQNVRDLDRLDEYMDGRGHHSWNVSVLGHWLPPVIAPAPAPAWLKQQPSASTSYLTCFEYQSRVPIHEFFRRWAEVKTLRRAILLQLALQLYGRDHGKYPESLSELVPDYLPEVPIDPYSRKPFRYPLGLDLPLWNSQNELPAQSPFFWSVGPNGAELTRHELAQNAGEDADGTPREVSRTVYSFTGRDARWHNRNDLVFPLPKLPAKSANPPAP